MSYCKNRQLKLINVFRVLTHNDGCFLNMHLQYPAGVTILRGQMWLLLYVVLCWASLQTYLRIWINGALIFLYWLRGRGLWDYNTVQCKNLTIYMLRLTLFFMWNDFRIMLTSKCFQYDKCIPSRKWGQMAL